ncbi:MAG: hypothetical protein Q8N08_09320 [Methanobacteriaceae archaeon]|nr:hypothetical protein [Methanobacteriaceae archaeon]
MTDDAMRFYKRIQKNKEEIHFIIITADELISDLIDLKFLEVDSTRVQREFERWIENFNIIINCKFFIEDKENAIFLEYLNGSYYWICIVSSNSGKYFLILDKNAELPKQHKSLAKQLKEAERDLEKIDYLLAEKIELDPNILLKTIATPDNDDEWKYLFMRAIELLNNNGYLDILIELLKTFKFKSSSEKAVIGKVEEISDKLMYELKNSKEDYLNNARHVSNLLPFVYNYNIIHNKNCAIENLKKLIKNDSRILVFDKSERSNCFERISKNIDIIKPDTNNSDRSSYFILAYYSTKHALDELNAYLKQEVSEIQNETKQYTMEISVSDYDEPDPYLIELYQYQKRLLEKAKVTEKGTENIALIDKDVSEITKKIYEYQIKLLEKELEKTDNDDEVLELTTKINDLQTRLEAV